MHCMLSPCWLGRHLLNDLTLRVPGSRPLALVMAGLFFLAHPLMGQRASAVERDVMSHTELDQIGLMQAWRRHLSVPAGTPSIVDHKLYVHKTSPKQYVEVVGKSLATAPANTEEPAAAKKLNASATPAAAAGKSDEASSDEANPEAGEQAGADDPSRTAAELPVYARYLLEIPHVADLPDDAEPMTATGRTSPRAILERMTMSGGASFASSGLLDRAEAERRARNDIRRLKRRGIEAEIQFREVPTIRMYTLAEDGTLECRDAETGEIVWLQRVGNRNKGYSGFGVDDRFLTVVNGSDFIKLDTPNGGVYGVTQLELIPTRGPQHCGNYAVVPSVGSRMVAYPLADEDRDTITETVYGDALASPSLAIGSQKIAWGTSEQFVYVLELSDEPTMNFRLNTDGNVHGRLAAASGNRFYFGSATGQIYGLRATRTGDVMWTRPTGEPIHQAPVVFDDRVLFQSTDGTLMCVDAATGADCWDQMARGVELVIGVIGDRIYIRTMSGTMEILDCADGKIVHQLTGVRPDIWSTNIVSDRLYLLDKHGTIQCLRRPEADMPTLTLTTEPEPADPASDQDAKKSEPKANDGPATDDPFGDAADPFGGGADPFGGGDDPFGGGGDPFGG